MHVSSILDMHLSRESSIDSNRHLIFASKICTHIYVYHLITKNTGQHTKERFGVENLQSQPPDKWVSLLRCYSLRAFVTNGELGNCKLPRTGANGIRRSLQRHQLLEPLTARKRKRKPFMSGFGET